MPPPEAAEIHRPFFERIAARRPLMRFVSDLEYANFGVAAGHRLRAGDRAVGSSAQGPLVGRLVTIQARRAVRCRSAPCIVR